MGFADVQCTVSGMLAAAFSLIRTAIVVDDDDGVQMPCPMSRMHFLISAFLTLSPRLTETSSQLLLSVTTVLILHSPVACRIKNSQLELAYVVSDTIENVRNEYTNRHK